MKADLHVHSKFSKRPSQWFLQKVGCPESFTEPAALYRLARKRGMGLVTITDHNRIDGALEIAHLPGVFISEEITSYFPEDRCKVHVLAFDITENQHGDIQRIRNNVFELADYLIAAGITHAVAHPLYAVNDRLTCGHFEQMLLLFKNFELNGDCNPESNHLLIELLSELRPALIDRMADKYNFEPRIEEPWKKNFIGGSDDHSALNIARNHTRVAGATSVALFLDGIEGGRAEAIQQRPSPQSMAHNLYSIAYQFYRHKLGLGKYVPNDVIIRHIDHSLRPETEADSNFRGKLHFLWQYRSLKKIKNSMPDAVVGMLRREAARYITWQQKGEKSRYTSPQAADTPESKWFQFVNRISNVALLQFADHLLDRVAGANLFDIFHTIGSAGGFYTLMAPYFVAYSHYGGQRKLNVTIRSEFAKLQHRRPPSAPVKVAIFTDGGGCLPISGADGNGSNTPGPGMPADMTVVSCRNSGTEHAEGAWVRNFEPLGTYDFENDARQKLYYPPVIEMLDYCYREAFTHAHLASCGPVGLTGLFIARMLKLPTTTVYQASLFDHVRSLTGDDFMEDLAWRYAVWFYNHADRVFVPGARIGKRLSSHGAQPSKLFLVKNGEALLHSDANASGWHVLRKVILDPESVERFEPPIAEIPRTDGRTSSNFVSSAAGFRA